jgi:hypothetical protein
MLKCRVERGFAEQWIPFVEDFHVQLESFFKNFFQLFYLTFIWNWLMVVWRLEKECFLRQQLLVRDGGIVSEGQTWAK